MSSADLQPVLAQQERATVAVITEPLGGSPLSQLIQAGRAPAGWVVPRPSGPAGWADRIDGVRQAFAGAGWLSAVAPALRLTAGARERLERVARDGGVLVTTGQQPGLFGGPIYTWSKALSALALADAIERELHVPAAPLFWAATDDADLLEAQSVWLPTAMGAVEARGLAVATAGTPAARVPQGELSQVLGLLRDACGSVQEAQILEAACDAYGDPERTIGDAYLRMLEATLGPLGIPILDAAHPAVARAADPLLRRALTERSALLEALARRADEIRAAGFTPQVEDVAGLTPVFAYDASGVKRRVPVAEAAAIAGDPTVTLGGNVLLRPVLEAAILPTVAYVAGPGELAYFAQVSAAAEVMQVRVPLSVPRWSGTLVEPRIERILERLQVSREELVDPHRVEAALARASLPVEVGGALAGLNDAIEHGLERVTRADESALLPRPVLDGFRRRIRHQTDRLERRALAAVKRREAAMMTDVARARGFYFPGGIRQERALSIVPTLARYGPGTLSAMLHAARAHATSLLGVRSEQAGAQ